MIRQTVVEDLRQLAIETFEIEDLKGLDMNAPAGTELMDEANASFTSCSCSTSSCCTCSTSSCCSTSTSTSSCA